MKLLSAIIFSLLLSYAHAEEYETAGGYDYKAAEKSELEAKRKQQKINKARFLARQAEKERKELLPENMARLKEHEVCIKAGKNSKSHKLSYWITELKRRNTLFDEQSIKNRQVKIHGYECDIFAAYGKPIRYNRRVSTYGTSVQFVYNKMYIYTDNGIITSWSD